MRGELHREAADAAARPFHQHGLAGLQLPDLGQSEQGRRAGHDDARGLVCAQPGADRNDLRRIGDSELGVAGGPVAPDQREHRCTDQWPGDALAQRLDGAGHLAARRERQRCGEGVRAVAATQDVGEVDRGSLDTDEHLPGPRDRLWAVLEDQHVGTAEGMGTDELHSEASWKQIGLLAWGRDCQGARPCVNRSVYFAAHGED